MKVFVLGLLVAACGGSVAEPPPPRVLEIPISAHVIELPNGIKASVVEDSSADLESVLVRVHTGAVDDPAGQAGVAHLAAHLSYVPGDVRTTLWDELDEVATSIDVLPDAEHTDLTAAVSPAQLAALLHLEAQRLTRSCGDIPAHWFMWLRGQVADEVRANSSRLTNRAVTHALYAATDPYHAVYDVDPASVAALTQHDTCAFIEQHYAPGNIEVVVSGPVTAAQFETIARRELGAVPARAFTSSQKRPPPQAGMSVRITADVAEPTLAVSWPIPDDDGAREVMLFAANALADKLHATVFADDHQVLLWLTKNEYGIPAATERVRAALQPSLISAADFEKARTSRVTAALARLDALPERLRVVARNAHLDEAYRALEVLDPQRFDALVATHFEWARARVVELQPDGSRPPSHPATLADPRHAWKGPSNFPTDDRMPASAPIATLAHARIVTLPNGMRIVLAPTSRIPLVELELAVIAGRGDEPEDHPGTAVVAAAAFDQLAKRGPHAVTSEWAAGSRTSGAGLDISGIAVRGPSMYMDQLVDQLAGVTAPMSLDDLQKGREQLVELATSPLRGMWERGDAVRGQIYGRAHPYARARTPTLADVRNFDARVVEDFYAQRYAPDNAVLIVTGGFDVDAAVELLTRTFGGWQGHAARSASATPDPAPAALAASDSTPVVQVSVFWPGHGVDDAYEARTLLASTMSSIWGQSRATYNVHPRGSSYELDAALDPATADRDIKQIVDGLGDVVTGTPRYRAAFTTARRRGALARTAGVNSLEAWTSALSFALLNGHDLGWLAASAQRLASTSYDDVAKLAVREISLDRATWYVRGPHDAVAAVYRALDLEPRWLDP